MEVATAMALTTAASVFYTKKAADAQKKQIKASTRAAEKQSELEKQQINLTLQDEQRRNRNLLAKQQSAYKAKLGAGGLSQTGSGQAYLDSMQKEHDTEDKYLTEQAGISLAALQNSIDETRTRNLLELTQQSNLSRGKMISDIGNFTSELGRSIIK